jgi:hypothetical protein
VDRRGFRFYPYPYLQSLYYIGLEQILFLLFKSKSIFNLYISIWVGPFGHLLLTSNLFYLYLFLFLLLNQIIYGVDGHYKVGCHMPY